MANEYPLEQQIINLELKVTHQEHLNEELNMALYEQQKRIDVIEKELLDLKKNLQAGSLEIRPSEKPPHY